MTAGARKLVSIVVSTSRIFVCVGQCAHLHHPGGRDDRADPPVGLEDILERALDEPTERTSVCVVERLNSWTRTAPRASSCRCSDRCHSFRRTPHNLVGEAGRFSVSADRLPPARTACRRCGHRSALVTFMFCAVPSTTKMGTSGKVGGRRRRPVRCAAEGSVLTGELVRTFESRRAGRPGSAPGVATLSGIAVMREAESTSMMVSAEAMAVSRRRRNLRRSASMQSRRIRSSTNGRQHRGRAPRQAPASSPTARAAHRGHFMWPRRG